VSAPTATLRFPLRLAGLDLGAGEVARLAGQHGLSPCALGDAIGGDGALVAVARSLDGDRARQALRAGARALVELDGGGLPPTALDAAARGLELHLSLSTGTAFSLDTAALVAGALAERCPPAGAKLHEIEVTLHEALTNAVVHGNLGLTGGPSDDPGAFSAFYDEVRRRLSDPARAARRVEIEAGWDGGFLEISVADQGDGYEPAASSTASVSAKSGRGLQIMRELASAVCIGDGGRRLTLRFAR